MPVENVHGTSLDARNGEPLSPALELSSWLALLLVSLSLGAGAPGVGMLTCFLFLSLSFLPVLSLPLSPLCATLVSPFPASSLLVSTLRAALGSSSRLRLRR